MSHPITEALRVISDALKDVTDINPLFMTGPVRTRALEDAFTVRAQLDELVLRMMVNADDVFTTHADRDIAAWTRHTARLSMTAARRMQALAHDLDRSYPVLSAAMREGAVNFEQAHVIADSLNDLPAEVGPGVVREAEAELVGNAAMFDPSELRRLGRKVLHVVAPEIAEAIEAKRLAEMEADAERRSRLTLRPQGDGTTRISGLIPDSDATRLAGYLHAFTNPRVATGDDPDLLTPLDPIRKLPYPRRLGDAFRQFLESIDPKRLPIQAGDATTLMVTISLDALRSELGTATVLGAPESGNDTITAAQARRLACNAGIIPVVLGGEGQVLDLGRTKRLFTGPNGKRWR